MSKMKLILLTFTLTILGSISTVNAGTISYARHESTSSETYKFYIDITDLKSNYLKGSFQIENGTITKITMNDGWLNKTGTNNNFYFYHNGISDGNYTIASIEVKMTGNSTYKLNNLEYGANKCIKDANGLYFGLNGNVVNETTYNNECVQNTDASLQSLIPSYGKLSPDFKSSTTAYTMTVGNAISSISFKATTNNGKANIISDTTCNLEVGPNACEIIVQAQAGNQTKYTINITRKESSPLSSDASIKELQIHNGTLNEIFSPSKANYTITIPDATKKLYLTYKTNADNSLHTTDEIDLSSAPDHIFVTITAPDNVTKMTYTFEFIYQIFDIGTPPGPLEPPEENNNNPLPIDPETPKDENTNPPANGNNTENIENPETGSESYLTILLAGIIIIPMLNYTIKKKNKIYKI